MDVSWTFKTAEKFWLYWLLVALLITYDRNSAALQDTRLVNVKLRCFQSTRKFQRWFSIKDRQALLNRFNVVYKLTCSCGASYIGQTQRSLINRIEEHRTSLSSSVSRHLQANPDHRLDFHNPEVISSDNNWWRLQILESSLIQGYGAPFVKSWYRTDLAQKLLSLRIYSYLCAEIAISAQR